MTAAATEPDPSPTEADELEAAADEAIAACCGDLRATVKALLVANAYLEHEVATAIPAVSYGFSKGWHQRRRQGNE